MKKMDLRLRLPRDPASYAPRRTQNLLAQPRIRRNRTKAWVTETATQDVDWKGNREPEVTYQDQDVRLREPERANSHVPPASRRGSDASNASRMIKRSPGQESRERSGVAGSSLASRRRSVLSVDLHPRKRPSEASEMIEGSLISRRRSGESADVRSSRRSRITSPQKEKIDTAYRRWEEPSFTRRSRRKSSPVPQEEMSLTDYADLPPTTRNGRESDREDPYVRTRVRIEPPLSPLRENTISKKNGASRYSMETPCIHVDPHRATRSHYDSHRAAEFEAPLRTPPANSYRDENSPRHPSTRVQDTYAETSSVRSARRRPRSPRYETSRRAETERTIGPARETSRIGSTGESTANNLEALIGVLQAPKVDLPTFKGDPMQYHIFMRAFDDNVERVISDPSSKLARLVQLCTGEAGRVIRGCTLMRPERGYVRARQLLKDRYGDEFVIAELWGQRLLNRSTRMSLREFADELRAGYESLDALDALDELQTQGNLSEIIKKLPAHLQNKWRDVARCLKIHEHRRPDLQDVVEYVEEAAAVASDPVYGNQGQKSERNPTSTRAAYATSTSSSCPICEN